jgi:hypothetical protein
MAIHSCSKVYEVYMYNMFMGVYIRPVHVGPPGISYCSTVPVYLPSPLRPGPGCLLSSPTDPKGPPKCRSRRFSAWRLLLVHVRLYS